MFSNFSCQCLYEVCILLTGYFYCSYRANNVSNWTRVFVLLEAEGTDSNSRLELRSTTKGVIWFDQVSLMPLDTYNVCMVERSSCQLNKFTNYCNY